MRVSMSAIGSVIMLRVSLKLALSNIACEMRSFELLAGYVPTRHYQLDFRTPGIIPLSARLRKQIRQIPNLRYTARGRPHILQRRSRRTENLGSRFALAIFDFRATTKPVKT